MGKLIDADEFIEWLLSDAITDEQRQFAEKVRYAAERMQSATDTNVGGTDCISRTVALKELENLNIASFYEENEHSKEAYTEVKAMLKALPPSQPGWISCREGLPKLGIRYNVTYESGEVGYADFRNKVIYGDKCIENVWDIPEYYEDDGQVVAWMPLPPKWEGRQG